MKRWLANAGQDRLTVGRVSMTPATSGFQRFCPCFFMPRKECRKCNEAPENTAPIEVFGRLLVMREIGNTLTKEAFVRVRMNDVLSTSSYNS